MPPRSNYLYIRCTDCGLRLPEVKSPWLDTRKSPLNWYRSSIAASRRTFFFLNSHEPPHQPHRARVLERGVWRTFYCRTKHNVRRLQSSNTFCTTESAKKCSPLHVLAKHFAKKLFTEDILFKHVFSSTLDYVSISLHLI